MNKSRASVHEEWQRMIEAQAQSDQSISAWCRKHGWTLGQFYNRRRLCQKESLDSVSNRKQPKADRNINESISERSEAKSNEMQRLQTPERSIVPGPLNEYLQTRAEKGHVYMVGGLVEKRVSTSRLRAIVEYRHGRNPRDGSVYLFRGKAARVLHILMWDGDGFVHMVKRSEARAFRWPRKKTELKKVSAEDIAWLLLTAHISKGSGSDRAAV